MTYVAGVVAEYKIQPGMMRPILSPSVFGQNLESPRDDNMHLSWLQQAVDDSPDLAAAIQVVECKDLMAQQDWPAVLECVDTAGMPSEMAHLFRGIALCGMKKHAEAILCFDDALKINPGFATTAVCKGCALSMLNRYDEAMACIGGALETNPEYSPCHYLKGVLMAEAKKHESALACLDAALTLDPESSTCTRV